MSTIISLSSDDGSISDPLGPRLAARIRLEREVRGLTVAALAEKSGVSRAMISKVERAEASPTAALLGRLSGALGLTVSTLLSRAEALEAGGRLARVAEQAVWIDPATGYVRRALSPPGADPELVLVELPPEAAVPYPAASYGFLRGQCVWALSGNLLVREGTTETLLRTGDTLAFDLSAPQDCTFRNPSRAQVSRYVVALARR
jgi:transcriptional regulator with XRE-family HTH domain